MIDPLLLNFFLVSLVVLNGIISVRLALMYRKDYDKRKLMFIIGLLLTSHAFLASIQGTNNSSLLRQVFEWCPLPMVFGFLFKMAERVAFLGGVCNFQNAGFWKPDT